LTILNSQNHKLVSAEKSSPIAHNFAKMLQRLCFRRAP
jgi:hypothetical protein